MHIRHWLGVLIAILLVISIFGYVHSKKPYERPLGFAVEYNNHAACCYIARHHGWFEENGINAVLFDTYVTGVALAAGLARGDIDAAYLCLGPAIIAYSRGVPIKIVAGTHFHGYVIVGKPEVKALVDLEGKRIGCVREGSQMDLLLQLVIDKYDLSSIDLYRMNPPKQLMLLSTGQIDVAFLPEHWATIAISQGFNLIARSQEIWPEMEGSVLAIKQELIDDSPKTVQKLVDVTVKGTDFINEHRDESSIILAEELKRASPRGVPRELVHSQIDLITPELLKRSMKNLEYTVKVDIKVIQEYIELLYKLNYIDSRFNVSELVDLRFLETG